MDFKMFTNRILCFLWCGFFASSVSLLAEEVEKSGEVKPGVSAQQVLLLLGEPDSLPVGMHTFVSEHEGNFLVSSKDNNVEDLTKIAISYCTTGWTIRSLENDWKAELSITFVRKHPKEEDAGSPLFEQFNKGWEVGRMVIIRRRSETIVPSDMDGKKVPIKTGRE